MGRATFLLGSSALFLTAFSVGAASGQVRAIGSAVAGNPRAIWVDINSDGRVDGYVLDGVYYPDTANQVRPSSAGSSAASTSAQIVNDPRWGLLADLVGGDWRPRGFNYMFSVRAVSATEIDIARFDGKLGVVEHWGARLTSSGLETRFRDEIWKPAQVSDREIKIQYPNGKYYLFVSHYGDPIFLYSSILVPVDTEPKFAAIRDRLLAEGKLSAPGGVASSVVLAGGSGVVGAQAAPAPVAPPLTEARKAKWGSLAQLPGKSWYCVGGNPAQWFARKRIESGYGFSYNRSPPVIRLTTADWLDPFSSMKVTTTVGDGRRWVDTISLQPDGSFLMVSEGVQAFSRVRGTSDGWTVTFPLGKYDTNQNKLTFGGYQGMPEYKLASGAFGDDAGCMMKEINSPEIAAQFKQEFLMAQRDFDQKSAQIPGIQADMENDRAAGAQMRGNMTAGVLGAIASGGGSGPVAYFPNTASISGTTGSSFYEQLRAMADQAHGEAEQSKRQLDRTIAQGLAQRQNGSGAGAGNTQTAAAANGGTSGNPNTLNRPATASASPVAVGTAAAAPRTITQYVWCYGRLQPSGKHGDEYYSNIQKVTITSEQSYQRRLEDGVTANWNNYLAGVAGLNPSRDYSYCRKYDTQAEAEHWLADEMTSWGHYGELHHQSYFPTY